MVTLRPTGDREKIVNLAKTIPELDILSIEACLTFIQTMADVQSALEAHFARHGLSMGKFTLLMQLLHADEKGLTPSQCAEGSGVTRATITGLLDGLERDELVRRKPYPSDRRMLTIELTEKGRSLLSAMLPEHFCCTEEIMAHLTETEKNMLVELLTKVQAGTKSYQL